ncbi:uncharacterized protein LOC100901129 [Galendromus occidentalis]|uniref:Uncharacterized protein LOC100901129 n=1 Tax=Galendromus occidentalis TaxID=34638 RepID=A0AAJ6VZD4_9ACAR|nr:uncharacterized protein LOC100901129 [Galendromus occidentalis]
MLVNQHAVDPRMPCPGSHFEGNEYIKRVRDLIEDKPFEIKPGDRRAFGVLVHHFAHNKNRELILPCIDLMICRGFICSAYNPGDYSGVVCRRHEKCCSRTKLFIELLHFFRLFHRRSAALSVRKRDLMLLDAVLILSRDTTEEDFLEFEETSAEEIALIFECQQIQIIDEALSIKKGFKIEKLEDLEYFRKAQAIRDRHGVERDPRPAKCFESMEDIDALVEQLEQRNPVEFLSQSYALGLINSRLLRTMYHTANDFEQLVSLLDRTADSRDHYDDVNLNREHSRMFIAAFSHIRRLQPTWFQAVLLFLIGVNVPDGWHLPCTDLETIPQRYLDIYLHYLLIYSLKCLTKPDLRIDDLELMNNLLKLPGIIDRLLARGASLVYAADSHAAVRKLLYRYCPSILLRSAYVDAPFTALSSLGALIRLTQIRRELTFGDWLPDLCCHVRRLNTIFFHDNTRLSPLRCLAARAYVLDRDCKELPVGLRGTILLHQDLKHIISPKPEIKDPKNP